MNEFASFVIIKETLVLYVHAQNEWPLNSVCYIELTLQLVVDVMLQGGRHFHDIQVG